MGDNIVIRIGDVQGVRILSRLTECFVQYLLSTLDDAFFSSCWTSVGFRSHLSWEAYTLSRRCASDLTSTHFGFRCINTSKISRPIMFRSTCNFFNVLHGNDDGCRQRMTTVMAALKKVTTSTISTKRGTNSEGRRGQLGHAATTHVRQPDVAAG